jgi:hypothetical protein
MHTYETATGALLECPPGCPANPTPYPQRQGPSTWTPAQPSKRSRRPWWIAAAAVVGVALTAGALVLTLAGSGDKTTPGGTKPAGVIGASTFTLVGTFDLDDPEGVGAADDCQGFDGYSAISAGANVVVSDPSGTTIAVGALSTGSSVTPGDCHFTFTIPDVPAGKGFYGVAVTHRGVVQYSEAQARQGVSLSLGN